MFYLTIGNFTILKKMKYYDAVKLAKKLITDKEKIVHIVNYETNKIFMKIVKVS